MSVNIVLERGPETKLDVLVNVWSDGRRAGTIALSKATWAEMWERGSVEVYVADASKHRGEEA